MEGKDKVLNYNEKYSEKLLEAGTPKKTIESFCEYNLYNLNTGLVVKSISIYASVLYQFLSKNKKEPEQITAQDVKKYISTLTASKNSSYRLYRFVIHHYLTWLYNDKIPEEIEATFKLHRRRGRTIREDQKVSEKQILSEKQIEEICSCITELRDKAFIFSLFDTGCRCGEWSNVKLSQIEQHEKLWIAKISGKTGERKVFLTSSVPIIKAWLKKHPLLGMKNIDPYLFVPVSRNKTKNTPIGRSHYYDVLKEAAKKAGITGKSITLHAMRHSRVTIECRKGTNAALANQMFGWGKSSSEYLRYSWLTNQDVEDEMKKRVGMIDAPIVQEKESATFPCPHCDTQSSNIANVCSSCGFFFHPAFVQEEVKRKSMQDQIDELSQKYNKLVMMQMQNPAELEKKLEEKIKKEFKKD